MKLLEVHHSVTSIPMECCPCVTNIALSFNGSVLAIVRQN